jgi:uncharacterized repeat protein (TIGR02059 family)
MKRFGGIGLIIFFVFTSQYIIAQTDLTLEGKTYTNSEDTWLGVNVPRTVPTRLVFKNNTITSVNRFGYMLQAGDESPVATANNLDGALITGNKFNWSGSDMTVIPHGLFAGHNSNVIARYNYLNNVPMGIIRKSGNNMSNTGGGVAYNIIKGGAVGMVVKGMSNVNVYNNTFYNDRSTSQTWRPLLHIYTNTDGGRYSVAHGTKIYNNIFYTKYQTFAITIDDAESLKELKCDYNVYWCESGSPRFSINGAVKTFAQWQAMGYDTHSVVVNPEFKDLVNFAPSKRLDYGTDLGAEWATGLSSRAVWSNKDPETVSQNGTWQVGAVIYEGISAPAPVPVPAPVIVNSVINSNDPSVIEMTYSSSLAVIVPAPSAFNIVVNSVTKPVTEVNVSGNKVIVKIQDPVAPGDVVKLSYIRPTTNPLQGAGGVLLSSVTGQPVINNQNPPKPLFVSSVIENAAPAILEINYNIPLAPVIPPDSSFIVTVNGSAATARNVTISGSKVSLKLQKNILQGDIVTVSYIAPSSNPLQSVAGTIAEPVNLMQVKNNVSGVKTPGLSEEELISIYPNPARDHLNISISNPQPSIKRIMRIFDFSGKLCLEKTLETDLSHKLLIDLRPGFYIVQLEAGSIIRIVQKLIVVN